MATRSPGLRVISLLSHKAMRSMELRSAAKLRLPDCEVKIARLSQPAGKSWRRRTIGKVRTCSLSRLSCLCAILLFLRASVSFEDALDGEGEAEALPEAGHLLHHRVALLGRLRPEVRLRRLLERLRLQVAPEALVELLHHRRHRRPPIGQQMRRLHRRDRLHRDRK